MNPMGSPKVNILIVDDEEDMRRIFGAKLAAEGYGVLYAEDGNQGREMARRFRPNLILLDVTMPVMDGFETATRLKSEPETKDIPIIFLTNADLSIEAQKASKELGISDYIHKSIDLDEFIAHVKKIVPPTAG